ncbi:MAG: hydrogenase maturation protease [Alphaproteobacteria bacterium]|nr:hydrogenase maturation protease [Alphaproteobacteria bacterium]
MPAVTVVGLGQPAAGDDGVGCAIVESLHDDLPNGVQLVVLRDAAPLVELLDGRPVVLVDAVVGLAPGTLHRLTPAQLGQVRLWSTHGMGVTDALGLAEAIHGPGATARLAILGVGIDPPTGPSFTLSETVAGAIPTAIAEIHALCRELAHA